MNKSASSFKIATWNVNSLSARLGHVIQWLKVHRPDVLALQETKIQDSFFPISEFKTLDYHLIYSGQKAYNGMALLSKYPMSDITFDIPNLEDPQRRLIITTINDIRILNVYVPNGASLDSEKYAYKLDWLEKLAHYVEKQLSEYKKLILLGDFNIAPEDIDVHNPDAWVGQVLVSAPERTALQKLLSYGLSDVFRKFDQPLKNYSWWDYRMLAFRRNHGLRIDLILANTILTNYCTKCFIDKEPRRLERPSDHAPVVAEFEIE